MASVRAGPRIDQNFSCGLTQTKGIVEFADGKQTTIGGNPQAVNSSLIRRSNASPRAAFCASPAATSIRGSRHGRIPLMSLPAINACAQHKEQQTCGMLGGFGLARKCLRITGVHQKASRRSQLPYT